MKKSVKYIFIVTGIVLFLAAQSFSQEDMTHIQNNMFKKPMRTAAVFAHDKHNSNAKLEDCGECHHVYEKGVKVKGKTSEGQACAECHYQDKNDMKLASKYHNMCKNCHIEKKAGPIMCGECHKK